MVENLAAIDFALSTEDMAAIDGESEGAHRSNTHLNGFQGTGGVITHTLSVLPRTAASRIYTDWCVLVANLLHDVITFSAE